MRKWPDGRHLGHKRESQQYAYTHRKQANHYGAWGALKWAVQRVDVLSPQILGALFGNIELQQLNKLTVDLASVLTETISFKNHIFTEM